ncbi:MAG: CotH kinase family protein [Muribaculaceae bacterium]|nr:CotH kinase family protein [Muribaculaceae bacterium]
MRFCGNIKSRVALALLLALISAGTASALDLLAGNYCFDNSRLKFSQVKMIVGSVSRPFTQVYDMAPVPDHEWWQTNLPADIYSISYFVFVETDVTAGTYNTRISQFLDSLKNANGGTLRCTNLSSKAAIDWTKSSRWVFCPINDRVQSNGYWRPDYSYDAAVSGTLPVIYLNTNDSVTISSKDYYIDGNLWIDDALQPLGSSDEPLAIEVKGRGNWTWNYSDKKPYKIKFAAKQEPLGLDRSRHFVLLAHFNDFSGYLRNTIGFEMSRLLNMPYTPTQVPVELVLNGDYVGLYFLCEKIRVEGGRVDIVEQADNEMIADNVTGGWLLELTDDGNKVIEQHQNNDPANPKFCFVTQSPEVLSPMQRNYIHDLIYRADSCVYVSNKSDCSWEQILDIGTLARFYVIHEVMENVEAFSGSLFMYKDLGWNEKLKFGPVWDFDNSFFQDGTTSDRFIFDYDSGFPFLWIKEILKFPRFQQEVRAVWREFCLNHVLDEVINHAWQLRDMIAAAEQQDRLRWYAYASSHGPEKPQEFVNVLIKKAAWLNLQWNIVGDVNMDGAVTAYDFFALLDYIFNGNRQYSITCDVDGDGSVTANDLRVLYEILFGTNNQCAVTGDIDMDGAITAADVIALYDYLLGGNQQYSSTCDVDGDGNVTASDLIMLYNILLGE